jgi:hypothetical protein
VASYSINFAPLGNENPLSQAGAWTTKTFSGVKIESGGVRGNSASGSASLLATSIATFAADQTAKAVIDTAGNDDHAGVIVRGDFAVRVLKNTNSLVLLRWNGTAWGFENSVSHTWTNGHELEVSAATAGANLALTVKANGTTVWSPTVAGAGSTAGQPGLYYSAGNVNATKISSFSAFDAAGNSPALTDVDGDEILTNGQTAVAVAGTDLTGATFTLTDAAANYSVAQAATGVTATAATLTAIVRGILWYGELRLRATTGAGFGTIPITLNAEAGTKYVDLTTISPTAANRITAIPDLQAGWQLRWFNVVGGTVDDVTVYPDGTYDQALSVTSFDVQANAKDGQGYGATGTQSIGGGPPPTVPYVQERLIGLSSALLPNEAGLTLSVWRSASGPTVASPGPDQVITGVTTDANGFLSAQIAQGTLVAGDKVWIMVHKPGTPDRATARRVTPVWL